MKSRIIVLLGVLLAFAVNANALPTANSVITAQTPKNGEQNFIQGTDIAGTFKNVYVAGANGSICKGISVANTDSGATHFVTIEVVGSGGTFLLTGFNTVSPGAGQISTYNAFSPSTWAGLPLDQNQNPYFILLSTDTVKATFATPFTGSLTPLAQITVFANCSDF